MIYLPTDYTMKWEIREHAEWLKSGHIYFDETLTCMNVIRYYGPIDIALSGVRNAPQVGITHDFT